MLLKLLQNSEAISAMMKFTFIIKLIQKEKARWLRIKTIGFIWSE